MAASNPSCHDGQRFGSWWIGGIARRIAEVHCHIKVKVKATAATHAVRCAMDATREHRIVP
jgi:hypothetical protein